ALLVAPGEIREAGEAREQMQRCGKRGRVQAVHLSIARDEVEGTFPAEMRRQTGRVAEMLPAGAAAETDMLTVVDRGAGHLIGEGAGASAEPRPRFEESDSNAARGERGSGGQTGEAAADDDRVHF